MLHGYSKRIVIVALRFIQRHTYIEWSRNVREGSSVQPYRAILSPCESLLTKRRIEDSVVLQVEVRRKVLSFSMIHGADPDTIKQ
jgi:hypothetical protein